MPITYRIDTERNLVHTTASGTLTDEDVISMKASLVRNPDFRPGMNELSDIRQVEELAVTPEGIRQMVQQDEEDVDQITKHRLAIVVSQDLAFGMARMYEMLTEGHMENVSVFRELDEAVAWLESR